MLVPTWTQKSTIKPAQSLIKCVAPTKLKEELEQIARARNVSLAALLRLILSEYIKQKG